MYLARIVTATLIVFAVALPIGVSATDDRAISLHGVLNTRDLGGLETSDGRTVRKGQLIRSGEIDDIDAEGKAVLDGMGVSAIVDLRTTTEATANPASWPEGQGPARYHFPLMEQEDQEISDMRANIKAGVAKQEDTEKLFYDAFGSIATDYKAELRELFDVLLEQPEGEAVLYHCSGGKDRTGVTTAVLLNALGVTPEDIQADFLMSNVQKNADKKSVEIAEKINAAEGTNMTAEAVWPTLGVRKDHLEKFYQDVEADYGSVDNYLHDGLGLSDADLQKLKDRYLE